MTAKLKPGDKVYIVREYEPPDDKPFTWSIEEIEIKSISDRQITLATMNGALGYRTRLPPSTLGRIIFATKQEAIDRFVQDMSAGIAKANRYIITCSRGLAWAREQSKELARDAG